MDNNNNSNSLYIVEVPDDQENFQYEYGNLQHAREHYDQEETATIYEYRDGNYYFIDGKI
jgi:hypothetical protein